MLKERQMKILEFMKSEKREKGYPPTVREIGTALNIKSTSTVHKDLKVLEQEGYITKDPSKPRAMMILDDSLDEITPEERIDIVNVPVVGRIAAGQPILAEQNIEETFPVPAAFAGSGVSFMLTVRGESMIEAGILDGDYILVRQQETANNGEIVVAMIEGFEGEATVKTFYREKNRIRLQPENESMSPIIVDNVKILGKVTGVFRHL